MPAPKLLERLAPRSISDIVAKLVDISQKGGDLVPTVVFYNSAGHSFSGQIISADLKDTRIVVLLSGSDVTYVALDGIYSVTVINAEAFAGQLSFGNIDPAELREPVRPLALNRLTADFAERLSQQVGREITLEIIWDGIDRDDKQQLTGVSIVAEALMENLNRLAKDSFTAGELKKLVGKVLITMGAEKNLALANDCLTVTIAPQHGVKGRYDQSSLAKALNDAF